MEKLKLNKDYEVTVFKQDHFGKGITRIDDMLVFIDGALNGDICKIEITNIKKNFAYGKIKEIIKKSKDRVVPKCPYYDICGGCHIMHQSYDNQLEFKEQKVKELLERFTGLNDIKINKVKSNKQFNYRNKIILHGSDGKLGFYQEKTHDVVSINKCIITNEKINKLYERIQEYVNEYKSECIKNIMFRVTSLNEMMLVLDGDINSKLILPYLEEIDTVYINNELVKGEAYVLEEIFGIKFHIYPKSFFQVNYEMMLVLYKIVIDFYKDKNYEKVLDLYCGTGTIGMLVSKYVKQVIGVEVEPSAVKSANICRELNGIDNIKFIEGKVEDNIDLFKDIDSIIVDPPRSGLDKHTIDMILNLLPKSISYISCDPVTLARDLKLLLQEYDLIEVHPVDMFPNTYHVECVCLLEKK